MRKKSVHPLWSGNNSTAYIKPSWINGERCLPLGGYTHIIPKFLWSDGSTRKVPSERPPRPARNGTRLCLNDDGTVSKGEDTVGLWCGDEVYVPRCCGMVKLELSPDGEDWLAKCPKCGARWTLGKIKPSFFFQEDGSLIDPSGLSVGLWDEESIFIPDVPERNRRRYPAMKKFSIGMSKSVPKNIDKEGDEVINIGQLKGDIFSMLKDFRM